MENIEPTFGSNEDDELPAIDVWVNAGFGNGSHRCHINCSRVDEESTMILPDALVKELRMETGDDLDWRFDEEALVIYVKVVRKEWDYPDWLKD